MPSDNQSTASNSSQADGAAYVLAHPEDFKGLAKYCHRRSRRHLDEVVATLDALWSDSTVNVAIRTMQCALRVLYKEEWERRRRGISTLNAADIADMRFQFMSHETQVYQRLAREWVEIKPASTPGLTMLALATLAAESPEAAEPYFAALRGMKVGDPHTVTHFDPAFHDRLEAFAETAERALPAVDKIMQAKEPADCVVFAACDYAYFQSYAWALAESFLRHAAPGITLHLHLFDIVDSEVKALLSSLGPAADQKISLSREWTNHRPDAATTRPSKKAKCYYHLARFHRFWSLLNGRPEATGWLMDADLMFNHSPMALFDLIGNKDAGLWHLPGRLEPYNKMIAGLVGISPTPNGRRYLQRVAGYVAECVLTDAMPWGADQVAIYCVYMDICTRLSLDVAAVTAEIADGYVNEAAAVWPAKCDPEEPGYPVLQRRLEMLRAA